MKLIHKATSVEVKKGDAVQDFRGDKFVVVSWIEPRNPASTGRLVVVPGTKMPKERSVAGEQSYYPEVFNCEWTDRTDRQPNREAGMERHDDGVHYFVKENGMTIWEKFVEFGKDKAHRAGGAAFRDASDEQERVKQNGVR